MLCFFACLIFALQSPTLFSFFKIYLFLLMYSWFIALCWFQVYKKVFSYTYIYIPKFFRCHLFWFLIKHKLSYIINLKIHKTKCTYYKYRKKSVCKWTHTVQTHVVQGSTVFTKSFPLFLYSIYTNQVFTPWIYYGYTKK